MTINIYYWDFWPASMATRVMAEELKSSLPTVVITPVDMAKGDNKKPPFSDADPTFLPPLIENDKGPDGHPSAVWSALGTFAHLSQMVIGGGGTPIFIPPVPCVMPLTFQWESFGERYPQRSIEGLVREAKMKNGQPPNPTRVAKLIKKLKRSLDIMDTRLPAAGGFINWDFLHSPPTNGSFSIADIVVGSALTYTHRISPATLDIKTWKNVDLYLQMLEARPSFQAVFKGVTLGPGIPTDLG